MGIKNDCRRNAEGYSDPTAYEALKNMEQEDERFHKLLDTIFALCELSDFHIEDRYQGQTNGTNLEVIYKHE